jgi:glycosyltransferase involved in cell wall biosynthesis
MKIILATETYHPDTNGAAYFTYRLAIVLAKGGHRVLVFTPAKKFKTLASVEEGVTVYRIRAIPTIFNKHYRVSPFTGRIIKKIIAKERPDLCHIQSHFFIGTSVYEAAQKLGLPVIGTNHFMPDNLTHYVHLPHFAEEILKKIMWQQCVRLFSKFDIVSTPTKTAANLLEEHGFKKPITVISNGIDLNIFNPKNDGGYLREKYHLPNGPLILYVGRMEKEKNVNLIIKAFNLVLEEAKAHLILAGVGNELAALKNFAQEIGIQDRITFTGFISDKDLPSLYSLANVFIIAGIAELQSIVTLEAMASGLPVVAVEAMALPELVKDGINGYLFFPGDYNGLANKIIIILKNNELRKKMSEESLKMAMEHSFEKTLDQFEEIYGRLVK